MTQLAAARVATTEAAATLQAAMQATARARSAVKDAEAALAAVVTHEDDWRARAAARMATAAREGRDIPPLSVSDAQAQRRHAAKSTLTAARDALAMLEAEEREARAELAQAERQEQQLREGALVTEAERIAQQLLELRMQERNLVARLAVLEFDSHATLTQAVRAVLEHAPVRPSLASFTGGAGLVSDIHTPLSGGFSKELEAARQFWHEFDASLDGEPEPVEAVA